MWTQTPPHILQAQALGSRRLGLEAWRMVVGDGTTTITYHHIPSHDHCIFDLVLRWSGTWWAAVLPCKCVVRGEGACSS